jgi:predicted transposase YdaD
MRRDSIYYHLFQQIPSLLFQFVSPAPDNAADYRFDSVAVKEPTFEIDGVFLPPENQPPGIVYFCEVQFQKDEVLYERLFGESLLYFYRNRSRFCDWQAVVIYPTRSTEQAERHPYRGLFDSGQTHVVYLDELGEASQLPIEIALMLLTTAKKRQAPNTAKALLTRAKQEAIDETRRQVIIDLVVTIISYQFTKLSRAEVEIMLNIQFQETQVYKDLRRDITEEVTQEVTQQVTQEVTQQVTQEVTQQVTQEVTQQVTQEVTQQVTQEVTQQVTQEVTQQVTQEVTQQVTQEVQQEATLNLVLRLLKRQLGKELPSRVRSQVTQLPLPALEQLGEDLLDFEAIADLKAWLSAHPSPPES